MSVENLQKRKIEIETSIRERINQINDIEKQIAQAQATRKQWGDTVLIQRGQLLELDKMIREMSEAKETNEVEES